MLLTIDVGNTHTVLGLFEGEEVIEHWRLATDARRTADEIAVVLQGLLGQSPLLKGADVGGIAICSTVPSVLNEMREMCRRYYGDVTAVIVEPGVRTGMPVRMDNPQEGGSDPCVIVDFGTATSFDAVSAKGEYIGAVTAPGIEISVDALAAAGAQLHKVELVRPRSVIAKNTVEALQAGIIYGFAGQVDGIVERMVAELADDPDEVTVVATGGHAALVVGESRSIDVHEPWLTLIGLRLIYNRNTT
jgi:type III pantothenate kinase